MSPKKEEDNLIRNYICKKIVNQFICFYLPLSIARAIVCNHLDLLLAFNFALQPINKIFIQTTITIKS